jgi:predicted DNA-binding protein (MmcQ/YjbR family)
MADAAGAVVDALDEFARTFPEAWPDEPWGDRVVKVRKKIFVFLSRADAERPALTVKLPESGDHGLSFRDATPTGYGLGKHGWVTIYVDAVPAEERDVLFDFVEESYRAVAPKTLVKRLDQDLEADADAGSGR